MSPDADVINVLSVKIWSTQAVRAFIQIVSMLTLSAQQTKTDTRAISADPDKTARDEPSHQDLHCLPFCFRFSRNEPSD